MFNATENLSLIALAQAGNSEATDTLVRTNMGLVKSIARRFLNRGHEMDDLISLGTIGMIKAIRNFDFSQNVAFSTYAVPLIMGEIKRFIRDDGLIKISRELKRVSLIALRAKNNYIQEHQTEPTVSQLSELTGVDEVTLLSALEVLNPVYSLSGSLNSDSDKNDFCLEDLLGEDNTALLVENISLRQAVASLGKSERELIYYRYYKEMPQTQVAALLGISQVKVSREEKKIMQKLRRELM